MPLTIFRLSVLCTGTPAYIELPKVNFSELLPNLHMSSLHAVSDVITATLPHVPHGVKHNATPQKHVFVLISLLHVVQRSSETTIVLRDL